MSPDSPPRQSEPESFPALGREARVVEHDAYFPSHWNKRPLAIVVWSSREVEESQMAVAAHLPSQCKWERLWGIGNTDVTFPLCSSWDPTTFFTQLFSFAAEGSNKRQLRMKAVPPALAIKSLWGIIF